MFFSTLCISIFKTKGKRILNVQNSYLMPYRANKASNKRITVNDDVDCRNDNDDDDCVAIKALWLELAIHIIQKGANYCGAA